LESTLWKPTKDGSRKEKLWVNTMLLE
jgi:hypothetical protein